MNLSGSIRSLNSDLSYHGTVDKKGSMKEHFDYPEHVACDSVGNIYIAGGQRNRVLVFSSEGKIL